MEEAYQEEEGVSPEVEHDGASSPGGGAVYEEYHSGAEEHGEEAHEFLVDEDFA